MQEQDERIRDDVTGEAEPADDRRTGRGANACPRVRGLVYVDLLLVGGMPLLLVFELIRRLVRFVKKNSAAEASVPQEEEQPPRTKEFGIEWFTAICVCIFIVEETFIGLPYVCMVWHFMDRPDIEIPIEILLFPCHATLNLILFGWTFY